MPETVSDWLNKLGLGEYADAFAKNKIDWAILSELTVDDLKDMGVLAVGDRRKLLSAIDQLKGRSQYEANSGATPPVQSLPMSAPPLALARSRRQVTVLFADLVGFTSLTSRMDAEEVVDLLNLYFGVVDAAVVHYGGHIDKHIGDAVMAVFGAPVAHTNDPERAVRAALEIRRSVAGLTPPLLVHIGVASGQVIASKTGSDAHVEYTVTGDGVNLASRLTDQADPGEIIVSEAVRGAVGDKFYAEPGGQRSVKGLTDPIEVWRITGSSDMSDQGNEEIIGREHELATLAGELVACRKGGRGRVIVLRGEPGIGKSRLLTELGRLPEADGFRHLRSNVLDFGAPAERVALHGLVRQFMGLNPDADELSRANSVENALRGNWIKAAHLPHLNTLLDLPLSVDQAQTYAAMDGPDRAKGRRALMCDLMKAAVEQGPVMVEIEDAHWAEIQDLADLGHLAASICNQQSVVVITTRRAEDPLDAEWKLLLDKTPLVTLDLEPLSLRDARRFAEAQRAIDPALMETCIQRSGGNPLFLQQLLRNVDRLAAGDLPDSIHGIVQARLDGLAEDDRNILQAAAVLGQRFVLAAVRYILKEPVACAEELQREALIFEAGDELKFAHALIRDGAYETILKSRRTSLHLRAAEWYADHDIVLYAQHLDRASAPEAAAAYLAAATQYIDASNHDRALPLLERAMELEPEDCRFDIECAYGDVLRAVGNSARALDVFAGATASAQCDEQIIRARVGLAQVARQASRYQEALDSLAIAQDAAERQKSDSDLAQIHYLRGNLFFPLGRIDDILASTSRALSYADRTNSFSIQVGGFSNFGDANYMKGAMVTADRFYTQAVNLARSHGLNRALAANLHNRGAARLYLCEVERAKSDAEEAWSLSQKYFAPVAECVAIASLSAAHFVEGDIDTALELNEQGIRLGLEIGAQRFEAQARGYAARILFLQGRLAEAQEMGRSGMELALAAARHFTSPKELSAYALTVPDPREQDRLLSIGAEILSEGCVSHCHFFFYSDAIRIGLASRKWEAVLRYCELLEAFTRSEPLALIDLTIHQGRLLAECGQNDWSDTLSVEFDAFRARCADLGIKQTLSGLFDTLPDERR
ncbi:MAG: adenylate/guanylate cyclase domain-containing protein [Hyphomicrobiaceae bacterium]